MIGTVAAHAADAADASVFGLTFGQPLRMPECERSVGGDYQVMTRHTCFQSRYGGKHTSIQFPFAQSPKIMAGDTITCILIEGNLEGIAFNTHGVSDSDRIFTELVNKYGKPSVIERPIVKNRIGAQFNSVDAVWSLPNLHVLFQGVASSIDSGIVYVQTSKGAAEFDIRMKALTRDPRPL